MRGKPFLNSVHLAFAVWFLFSCGGPKTKKEQEAFGPPTPKPEERVIEKKKSISLILELKDGPSSLILLGVLKNYRKKIPVDLYISESSKWLGTSALCALPTNRFDWEWFRSKLPQQLEEAAPGEKEKVQSQWVENICRVPTTRPLPISLHTSVKENIPWLTHPEWLRVRVGPNSIAGEDCKSSVELNSTVIEHWNQKADAEAIGKAIVEKLNRCVEEWGMS